MSEDRRPRADIPLEDLDRELTVFVEIIGKDIESGYLIIHDPYYLESTDSYVEMTLEKALTTADEFCCDCFTRAMLDASINRS